MKNIIFLTIFTFVNLLLKAQKFTGLQQSNFNGAHGVFYNPAKLANNRLAFSLELFSVSATVNNNQYIINKDSALSGKFNYTSQNNSKPISIAAPMLEIHLPSLQVSLSNKLGIGFSTRVRVFNEINEINPYLINFYKSASTNGIPTSINDNKGFNFNIHAISDIGINAGYSLMDNDLFSMKAGASLKVFRGIGYFNFNNKGIMGTILAGTGTSPDSIHVSNIDLDIATSAMDYKKLQNDFSDPKNAFSTLFKNSAGNGFGGDLGGEIIFKSQRVNKFKNAYAPYVLKLGVSILDIGSLKYNSVKSLIIKGSGGLNSDSLSNYAGNFNNLRDYTKRNGFTLDSSTTSKSVSLPTTINIYGDYSISNKFFVSASIMLSMVTSTSNNPYYYNQFTIAPRFESKAIDVSIPLTYNFMSKDLKPGLALRLGPICIGSDDIKLLLQNSKGGNIYAGLRLAFNKKSKK